MSDFEECVRLRTLLEHLKAKGYLKDHETPRYDNEPINSSQVQTAQMARNHP